MGYPPRTKSLVKGRVKFDCRATLCITLEIGDAVGWRVRLAMRGEEWVNRGTGLKIVLGLVGVLFMAAAYPMLVFVRQEPALAMMMSLYVTLGVFLLLAIRNPLANRSLIAFTAWS